MVKINALIEEEFPEQAFTLLQIHDELVFEVKEERAEEFVKQVSDLLKNVVALATTLDVHASIGSDLSELK